MIDTRWLEGFLAVANLKSFTRAAGQQHVSISGLSRRVQALENWAGTQLLDRSGEVPTLTEAGALLLPTATDVLRSLLSTRRAIADISRRPARQLRIAGPHVMSSILFSWWLGSVSERLNSPRIVIEAETLPSCLQALLEGEVDLVACVTDPDGKTFERALNSAASSRFECLDIGTEHLVPVCIDNLPQENRRILSYRPECTLGWVVESAAPKQPLPDASDLGASLADGLRSMALAGLGIAWLPQRLIDPDLRSGRLVYAFPQDHFIQMSIRLVRLEGKNGEMANQIWDHEKSASSGRQHLSQGSIT